MKRECMIGMAMAVAVVAWGDVEIGPKDGFAAVRSVAGAKMAKTKDALIFTDIRYDMQISCHVRPIDTMQVTGFEFRYRVSGPTTHPKTGGEIFYAPIGGGISGGRLWRIPTLVRDGEWHELKLSLSSMQDINDWRCCGLMTDFRFDPTNADGGRLEIAWFRFLTGDKAAKAAAPTGKFHGEDAWADVKPETFKAGTPKRELPPSTNVQTLGGTAVPRVQTAGEKVRLRYSYRGPVPKVEFMPLAVALITSDGEARWRDDLCLPLAQCVKWLSDDVWALEFDYELPRYISGGNMLAYLDSPCLRSVAGRAPCARIEVKRLACDPEWAEKTSAKVVEIGGSPYFAVNGKPIYPLWGAVSSGRGRSGGDCAPFARHSANSQQPFAPRAGLRAGQGRQLHHRRGRPGFAYASRDRPPRT